MSKRKKKDDLPQGDSPAKQKKSLGTLISDGITKLKELIKYVLKYWKTPPEGKSLCFKEMAAYCVGGMGVSAATVLPTYLTAATGMYIAAALNFDIPSIVIIGVISSIFTIIKSPLVGMLIDNTKTKYGKFRPYLIWMPIPSILCIILIGWVPQLLMEVSYVGMIVAFTILFNLLQVFVQLYLMAFQSLVQVISPSPEERTGLLSIGSVVYSLGPSVISIFLPVLAGLFSIKDPETGKVIVSGMNMIATFKYIIPVMAVIFFALGYWTAFGTKERVVVSKKFVQKVRFFDGIKKTMKNKYFWLTTASTSIGVFRIICTSFTTWICIYMIQQDWALSISNAVLGMAYVPGMLFAPLLIKKLGKRKLVIFSNFLLAGISLIMILFIQVPVLLLVFTLLAILSNSIQVVTGPAMIAQYYDYQQYRTGDRLEGFLSQFSAMIGAFFGIFTIMVAPAISSAFGYVDNKDILYEPDVIGGILAVSFIVGAVSAALGAVPYFFWNLTEKRHRQIMDVLVIRAKAEDGLIEADVAKQLEQDIEAGVPDVIKTFFKKSEDELLAEAGDAGSLVLEGHFVKEAIEESINPSVNDMIEPIEVEDVTDTDDNK